MAEPSSLVQFYVLNIELYAYNSYQGCSKPPSPDRQDTTPHSTAIGYALVGFCNAAEWVMGGEIE